MNPLRAELDALLADYRRELPAKLAALEALRAAGRVAELRRGLHTLAGSAGTFGLPQVGDAARAAESCLSQDPDAAPGGEFAALFAALQDLGTRLASTG